MSRQTVKAKALPRPHDRHLQFARSLLPKYRRRLDRKRTSRLQIHEASGRIDKLLAATRDYTTLLLPIRRVPTGDAGWVVVAKGARKKRQTARADEEESDRNRKKTHDA